MKSAYILLFGLIQLCLLALVKAELGSCEIGKNEIFLSMGPKCDRTCAALKKPCKEHQEPPKSGCYCREGFARDFDNICIPEILCGR